MSKFVSVKCDQCGEIFEARVADRKRGWARFCSKSCKAKRQTQTLATRVENKKIRNKEYFAEIKRSQAEREKRLSEIYDQSEYQF